MTSSARGVLGQTCLAMCRIQSTAGLTIAAPAPINVSATSDDVMSEPPRKSRRKLAPATTTFT